MSRRLKPSGPEGDLSWLRSESSNCLHFDCQIHTVNRLCQSFPHFWAFLQVEAFDSKTSAKAHLVFYQLEASHWMWSLHCELFNWPSDRKPSMVSKSTPKEKRFVAALIAFYSFGHHWCPLLLFGKFWLINGIESQSGSDRHTDFFNEGNHQLLRSEEKCELYTVNEALPEPISTLSTKVADNMTGWERELSFKWMNLIHTFDFKWQSTYGRSSVLGVNFLTYEP